LFQNERYITCGIEAAIPPILQLLLWHLIDQRRQSGVELDYLQVFTLEGSTWPNIGRVQKITHSQETPPCQDVGLLAGTKPIAAKIFVIDDGDHSTMLLAEEY
jgi:hypothetical protein